MSLPRAGPALVAALCAASVPARPAAAPDDLAERARKLHFSSIVFDTHIDTTLRMTRADWDMRREHPPMPPGIESRPESQSQSSHADLPRMRRGGLGALFFGVVVRDPAYVPDPGPVTGPRAVAAALVQIAAVHKLVEDLPEDFALCLTAEQVREARRQGRIAALISLEGGHMIDNSLPILRMYAALGVRSMTLTHFYNTDWADSSGDRPRHDGLSPLGKDVVREMNRLGMLVDISHVSDETFRDVLEVSRAPLIASHSSCRALADHVRNMSDEMIRALAARGGVIAINYHAPYLDQARWDWVRRAQGARRALIEELPGEENEPARQRELARRFGPPPPVSWTRIVDHVDHVVRLVGPDHVALGSDFDGALMPEGMEDVARLPRLTEELLRRGYAEADVRKILGENVLRVMTAAERLAADTSAVTRR